MSWMPWAEGNGSSVGSVTTLDNPAARRLAPSSGSWVAGLSPGSARGPQALRGQPHGHGGPQVGGLGRVRPQPLRLSPVIGAELLFRGDTRGPAVIELAGGLWAHNHQAIGQGGQHANRSPVAHQGGPGNTVFVSCTRDLKVAKGFAGGQYVYLLRVNAGLDYNTYADYNAMQAEVMALVGIPLKDILAVRDLHNNQILANRDFVAGPMRPPQFHAAIALLAG
jgi:hypothetical protein